MYSHNRDNINAKLPCIPTISLDLVLKAEQKCTFFGAVLSPASVLMLTQIIVKFKSVHGALAALSTSDTFTVWSVRPCKSDFYWVSTCPKPNRKHSDYLISIFS